MFEETVSFIKGLYPGEAPVPLHAPRFRGNEKAYLSDCIDTTFVSYVGAYVTRFEAHIREFTGAAFAAATVSGTAALHMALLLSGVGAGDEVLTQPLTFVATANAVSYCGAHPVFLDVEAATLGLSPEAVSAFFRENTRLTADGACVNRTTGRRVAACVPMHTFGHPCRIDRIVEICREYGVPVVEDAAEALGSFYRGRHAGRFGNMGILSFNGNKPVTTGGGGMILTDDPKNAERARHLTTTAKMNHPWEFRHDCVGYNYRMSNINAAVGCAQMERIGEILENKRETARQYAAFVRGAGLRFFTEPENAKSNYWLNALVLEDRAARDAFLNETNRSGVQTRPVWTLMNRLPMYQHCHRGEVPNAQWLEDRLVNLPSSVRL